MAETEVDVGVVAEDAKKKGAICLFLILLHKA